MYFWFEKCSSCCCSCRKHFHTPTVKNLKLTVLSAKLNLKSILGAQLTVIRIKMSLLPKNLLLNKRVQLYLSEYRWKFQVFAQNQQFKLAAEAQKLENLQAIKWLLLLLLPYSHSLLNGLNYAIRCGRHTLRSYQQQPLNRRPAPNDTTDKNIHFI